MLVSRRVRKNRYKKRPEDRIHAIGFKQVGAAFLGVLVGISLIAAMSLMFIFGYDVLTQCDYFTAKTISVQGQSRLSAGQVLDAAGIKKGENIFSVNLQKIRKRLLAHPWIAEAEVSRGFPSSLAIKIKEHKPIAVLDFGRYFLVNTQGGIFKEASGQEAEGLPVVSGIDYSDWKVADLPETPIFASVMEVLRLGKSAESVLPVRSIQRIHVDREMGLTLETCGPISKISLGFGNLEAKYDRLARICAYIDQNNGVPALRAIDLRNPERIVACPVEGESPGDEDKKEV